MKSLLLKFAAPLQAWGTNSRFNVRQTDLYPSKSGVIGMLSACLGLRRSETEKIELLNQLNFAVRLDQPGKVLKDYHIARKYKATGEFDTTYLTYRYFLSDAIFLIALGHEDVKLIELLYESLQSPYFQPYFGRRSFPVNPDYVVGVYDKSPIKLLEEYPWQASNWYRKKNPSVATIVADAYLLSSSSVFRQDEVKSFSQKERLYGFRAESRKKVVFENDKDNTDHDVFNVIGE